MFNNERTFGVEIEFCTTLSKEELADALSAQGIPCAAERYNHETRNHWKIVTDGSVSQGFELVSPVLAGISGIETVKRAVDVLVNAGCSVDTSTGLHVHVGANDLNAASIANTLRRYARFEPQIDNVVPSHRRFNQFALSVRNDARALERAIFSNPRITPVNLVQHLSNRYRKLNVTSYLRHGTLEFRQHSGSLDGTKIANWIMFCVSFVEDSICEVELVTPPETVTPAPVAATTPAPRRNARGNAFRAIAQAFLNAPNMTLSAADIATAANISEASAPSYISMFRTLYPYIRIRARRGRGYVCDGLRSDLRMVAANTVPAPAPVAPAPAPAPAATPQINWILRNPEPGLFDGLPISVRAYFAERAQDFR